MSAIPVLTYGFEEKSRFGIVNGLRRSAGVSLFLPLTLIFIKLASRQYLQAGGRSAGRNAPWYQPYSAAIDILVGKFAIGGYAVIDVMILGLTVSVFGVVVWARLRQKEAVRGRMRAMVLAGAATVVAIQSLSIHWHG
ncbi:hypothetical protein BH10PLA1_BH10PLA1_10700 [soil metagenome]